ncbi:MAG TPA: septum formation initiator family protein [Actinomycetota bacterium]
MSVHADGVAPRARRDGAPARRRREARPVLDRPEPRTAVRLTARAALLLVVMLVIFAFAIAPLRAYLGQRSALADLREQSARLERQNERLQERLLELNDPRELERLARACLGMVRPGETAFVTIPETGYPKPPAC